MLGTECSIIICNFLLGGRVNIQNTIYEVNEAGGSVEVCARVRSRYPVSPYCPVEFEFTVILATTPRSAGY